MSEKLSDAVVLNRFSKNSRFLQPAFVIFKNTANRFLNLSAQQQRACGYNSISH
jgi:hypothetical protein